MRVDPCAAGRVGFHAADLLAVLDDRIAGVQVFDQHLMGKFHIVEERQRSVGCIDRIASETVFEHRFHVVGGRYLQTASEHFSNFPPQLCHNVSSEKDAAAPTEL